MVAASLSADWSCLIFVLERLGVLAERFRSELVADHATCCPERLSIAAGTFSRHHRDDELIARARTSARLQNPTRLLGCGGGATVVSTVDGGLRCASQLEHRPSPPAPRLSEIFLPVSLGRARWRPRPPPLEIALGAFGCGAILFRFPTFCRSWRDSRRRFSVERSLCSFLATFIARFGSLHALAIASQRGDPLPRGACAARGRRRSSCRVSTTDWIRHIPPRPELMMPNHPPPAAAEEMSGAIDLRQIEVPLPGRQTAEESTRVEDEFRPRIDQAQKLAAAKPDDRRPWPQRCRMRSAPRGTTNTVHADCGCATRGCRPHRAWRSETSDAFCELVKLIAS